MQKAEERSKCYGYARVSSKSQKEDRQVNALEKEKILVNNIFIDKASGKDFDRPEYRKLQKKLKKGDVLFILSIDRLGRNYEEILEQWRILTKVKQVKVVVMDMPLLNVNTKEDLLGTYINDLVLQLLSFVAENERRNIKERQREGIDAAKARGVVFGRPSKSLPDNFEYFATQYSEKR